MTTTMMVERDGRSETTGHHPTLVKALPSRGRATITNYFHDDDDDDNCGDNCDHKGDYDDGNDDDGDENENQQLR